MNSLTTEETKNKYINLMGVELGLAYYHMWQDVIWLHIKWKEYVELYGTRLERIDLLNATASHFFHDVEIMIWENILLHISKLTDPPKSSGKHNLSLRKLYDFVSDQKLKDKLGPILDELTIKTKFCRDWRNRKISHNDYDLAVLKNAKPLELASRKLVTEAIKSIDDVMDCISIHYENSTTYFDLVDDTSNGFSLIYYLNIGLIAEKKRKSNNSDVVLKKEDFRLHGI